MCDLLFDLSLFRWGWRETRGFSCLDWLSLFVSIVCKRGSSVQSVLRRRLVSSLCVSCPPIIRCPTQLDLLLSSKHSQREKAMLSLTALELSLYPGCRFLENFCACLYCVCACVYCVCVVFACVRACVRSTYHFTLTLEKQRSNAAI